LGLELAGALDGSSSLGESLAGPEWFHQGR
jgi:hypothetical protein